MLKAFLIISREKLEPDLGLLACPLLAIFFPEKCYKRAIFKTFTIFFKLQHYNISYAYQFNFSIYLNGYQKIISYKILALYLPLVLVSIPVLLHLMLYLKIPFAAVMVSFKLNLKLGCCNSTTNQNRFK